MNLFKKISPHNEAWRALKTELLDLRQTRIEQLLGPKDQDETNRLRGAIEVINLLLKAEEAAIKEAAHRG